MLLKKQTVWLLTMLSLVVVLSVYYVTSPENGEKVVLEEGKETTANEVKNEEGTESSSAEGEVVIDESTKEAEEEKVISSVSSDELFTALRLQMEENRSKMIEDLQAIMASSDVSAEQKSEALDKMQDLQAISGKEQVLETLIKAQSDEFKDVLVRADEDAVRITVKSEKLTPTQANKIIQLVRAELGKKNVAVEFSAK